MKAILLLLVLFLYSSADCQTNGQKNDLSSKQADLILQLKRIEIDDQKFRLQLKEVENKFGFDSPDYKMLWANIKYTDSINLIKVADMLDMYGWLGPDDIGEEGAMTIFLVIQHADQKTQEKYLPMMREAVQSGRAPANRLALLEDRVALGQGKQQIYGSQIGRDRSTLQYFVRPLKDPVNVNLRRQSVGLQPIEEYLRKWGIDWDPKTYLKIKEESEQE